MKPKFCKLSLSLSVGNRKSAVTNPIEIEVPEDGAFDPNTVDYEIGELVDLFVKALVSLPCNGTNYTRADVQNAVTAYFNPPITTA